MRDASRCDLTQQPCLLGNVTNANKEEADVRRHQVTYTRSYNLEVNDRCLPRLGQPEECRLEEHRLEERRLYALLFSARKLLGDKECFIGLVVSELDARAAFCFFVFVLLEVRSHYVTQAKLELTVQSRLVFYLCGSSCLSPPSAKISGVRQHLLFGDCMFFSSVRI